MLKTGDPCPCCGQPIKTKDPEILALLTYIQESGTLQAESHRFCLAVGRGSGKTLPFEMVVEECTPT